MVRKALLLIYRFKYIFLALAIVLCVLGVNCGPNLPLRLSLAELLPSNRTSVAEMHHVADYVGGVGYLVVLVGPTDHPTSYLEPIARGIKKLEDVDYVFYQREEYVLRDKALYLLPKKDFHDLTKNVRA